jgi:hypothetical protein
MVEDVRKMTRSWTTSVRSGGGQSAVPKRLRQAQAAGERVGERVEDTAGSRLARSLWEVAVRGSARRCPVR